MDFAHYTDDPVGLAVDLVNTFGWTSGSDSLASVADLTRFLEDRAGIWQTDLPPAEPSDLDGVRALRNRLRAVFDAPDADRAAAEINSLLDENRASPSLSTHGGNPHLHFEPDHGTLTEWLGVVTAMGLATVIADRGFERMGVCHAETCRDVYVDTSRNRSRLHCTDTCRTRENVAAHRERRRGDPGAVATSDS